MNFLVLFLSFTALLALYWVFFGQKKHNEMFNPTKKAELKAILFDMDGVLVDSFNMWHAAINTVLKKYGKKEMSAEEHKRKFWGTTLEKNAATLFNDVRERERFKKNVKAEVSKHVNEIKIIEGAACVLKKIKGMKKYKIGLITNSYRSLVEKTLEEKSLKENFDAIVTLDDVEKPKPYPDPILKACEQLKVEPQECIFVGDTKQDFKAGVAAGTTVVGFNTQGHLIISKLDDLLLLIDENHSKAKKN